PAPTRLDQTFALQQIAHRRSRRPVHLGMVSTQIGAQLLRPPTRPRPAKADNLHRFLHLGLPTMAMGRSRALPKTFISLSLVAAHQLTTPLPADAKMLAQCCHRPFATQPFGHETKLLIGHAGLLKRHRQGPPCRSGNLSTIYPVQSVSYLSGSDPSDSPPPTPSRKGRGLEPTIIAPLPR